MDPTEYMLSGGSSRNPAYYDPVHAASRGPWVPHPQAVQAQQYRPYPAEAPLPFGLQRPHHNADHFQHGPNGGLPPPGPDFRAMPGPDGHSGLSMPMRHWGHPMHQMSSFPGGPPLPMANQMGISPDGAFPSMPPSAPRGLGFQGVPRTAAQSLGPAGVTSEHISQPPRWSSFSSHDSPANGFSGQQSASHASPPPLPFSSSPHRNASHHRSSSNSNHRNSHPVFPLPFAHSPHSPSPTQGASGSERRRSGHTRSRRSMASRTYVSDAQRDPDDDHHRLVTFETPPPGETRRSASHGSRPPPPTEGDIRQAQMMRGLASSKMVASKTTLQSLRSVNIDDLPAHERFCVICYNDYGLESPEGVSEAPLQLPKCKHVFGDHCIKKWFEESDSCPYCRDKVHSEPKRNHLASRAFANAMRLRNLSEASQEELWTRFMSQSSHMLDFDTLGIPAPASERRAPPNDGGDEQRRTRSRRSAQAQAQAARTPASPPMEEEQARVVAEYNRSLLSLEDRHRQELEEVLELTEARRPQDTPERRRMSAADVLGGVFRTPGSQNTASHPSNDYIPADLERLMRLARTPPLGGMHEEINEDAWLNGQQLPNPLQAAPQGEPGMRGNDRVSGGERSTESRSESVGHNEGPIRPTW